MNTIKTGEQSKSKRPFDPVNPESGFFPVSHSIFWKLILWVKKGIFVTGSCPWS